MRDTLKSQLYSEVESEALDAVTEMATQGYYDLLHPARLHENPVVREAAGEHLRSILEAGTIDATHLAASEVVPLYFGAAEIGALREHKTRLNDTVSNILARVWPGVRAKLAALTGDQVDAMQNHRPPLEKIRLTLPGEMVFWLHTYAWRFDCSISKVVHMAAVLGEGDIAQLK